MEKTESRGGGDSGLAEMLRGKRGVGYLERRLEW